MFTTLIPAGLVAVLAPELPLQPESAARTADAPPAESVAAAQDDDSGGVPLEEGEKLGEWTGAIAGGLFTSFGNTERLTLNILADGVYRGAGHRITLGAWWYLGEETVTDPNTGAESTQTTDDRYGGRAQYDYFLSEKSYLLATALVEHDENASIDLRATGGLGYGRQFVDNEKLKFTAEAGVNYFVEEFIPTGNDNRWVARIATGVNWLPNENWTLGNKLETFPPFSSGSNWYTRSDTRLRFDLSASLFTQLQWLLDYNTEAAPGAKSLDHRLFFTVGWAF